MMTYAGIQLFMEKLKQLINCNENPLINNPSIICVRPQFQLLYDGLSSMIQTLTIDEHHNLQELENVNDLKKRFTYAAEEAQYIVDMFLSGAHNRNNEHFPTSEDLNPSLNLDDIRRLFMSVEVELMSRRINNMKIDSSRRTERTLNQSTAAQSSFTRNSQGSKKLLDEIFVGIDLDAELIRDKLVEDPKKLNVVSIVGMGGIGKTTLATKVFNDDYVKHHFHIRVWVTVSQTYDKRSVLIQILESIRVQLDLEKATDSRLREMVHKQVMGKRYLIVIDDIWHTETWDNLKLFFPPNNNGSRILLTSRLTEVAKHAKPDGFIHHLGVLDKEKSWELLCQKVFHGNECPEWSIKPGMQIVENCQGLPLAVVVIAGILGKEALSTKLWEEISYRTGSYIVGEENGCLETLALSYNHLPIHLRECFLYLGGFPEDSKFQVQRLIWLWMAEGLIQQDGNRSLEDIAEGYLMDLIDRNLVTVAHRRKSNGGIKVCKVHDLVRELCLKKAKEERFILKVENSQFSNITTSPYKQVRMFINKDIDILDIPYPSVQNLRSILCFSDFRSLSDGIAKYFHSFVLLTVLDLQDSELNDFPKGMELLVHLRYLAIWNSSPDFPPSICNLWNLQTLIYLINYSPIILPSNISDLVNLRHLSSYHSSNTNISTKRVFLLLSIEKPMSLQTISDVVLGAGVHNFQKCFPYIRKLKCTAFLDGENDFKSLTCLENLKLTGLGRSKNHITFPTTLKTLTLERCRLPWGDMSIIQSLPNLEVLKLKRHAFQGSWWNMDEHEFPQLKFLRLEQLDIKLWEAYSTSFPCLKQLEIFSCKDLEKIPLEIGDIPTLELIQIRFCSQSVHESVRRIQEEQRHLGNYDLKIDLKQSKGLGPTYYYR